MTVDQAIVEVLSNPRGLDEKAHARALGYSLKSLRESKANLKQIVELRRREAEYEAKIAETARQRETDRLRFELMIQSLPGRKAQA